MNPILQKVRKLLGSKGKPTDNAANGTEPPAKRSREERRSGRCRIPKEQQTCELKVGTSVLPALLVNESKRGFAALIDRLEGLKVGDKVELHTKWAWFKVRVVFINRVAPPEDAAPGCASWFQVGMKVRQRLQ
jgi:hypothetical protein